MQNHKQTQSDLDAAKEVLKKINHTKINTSDFPDMFGVFTECSKNCLKCEVDNFLEQLDKG